METRVVKIKAHRKKLSMLVENVKYLLGLNVVQHSSNENVIQFCWILETMSIEQLGTKTLKYTTQTDECKHDRKKITRALRYKGERLFESS